MIAEGLGGSMGMRQSTELREAFNSFPEAGPWVAKLAKKSVRQGSELIIIFSAPGAFRLQVITVTGRLPPEADIDLMAFHNMTRVVLEETRKPLTDDHQIVAAAAPAEILAVLDEMNFRRAPFLRRNPIPHWTLTLKTD